MRNPQASRCLPNSLAGPAHIFGSNPCRSPAGARGQRADACAGILPQRFLSLQYPSRSMIAGSGAELTDKRAGKHPEKLVVRGTLPGGGEAMHAMHKFTRPNVNYRVVG